MLNEETYDVQESDKALLKYIEMCSKNFDVMIRIDKNCLFHANGFHSWVWHCPTPCNSWVKTQSCQRKKKVDFCGRMEPRSRLDLVFKHHPAAVHLINVSFRSL